MAETTKYRRLVLMFDGTWNERHDLTNVARMFEAIDDYKPAKGEEVDPDCEPLQLVKYLKGVGTNFWGSLLGGAFGYGLSDIILEGYRWLSNNYRFGDEIFVFGFSRGAYSARSLVSLVHRCGGVLMLKPGEPAREADDAVLRRAYQLYRGYVETADKPANAEYKKELGEFNAKYCQPVTVKMLGVWDTVGALGIPDSAFKLKSPLLKPLSAALGTYVPWSRKHYVFHGQGLPCIVENAYHALAIDEHREDFAPTLWDTRKPENQEVKQMWFIGAHCNVGGGATGDEDDVDPDDLWQYSYIWMQNKAQKLGLRFCWTYGSGKVTKPKSSTKDLVSATAGNIKNRRRVSKTKPQDSYGMMLGGYYTWLHRPFQRKVVGTNASLHWSVKERIRRDKTYRPKSLQIPGSGPEIKCFTEIPDTLLPEEICSCKQYLGNSERDIQESHQAKDS